MWGVYGNTYRDDCKEDGTYYLGLGFWVQGSLFRVRGLLLLLKALRRR